MNQKSSNQPIDNQDDNKNSPKSNNIGLKVKMIISATIILLLITSNFTIYYIIGMRYNPNWNIETVDSDEHAWDIGCSIGLTPEGTPAIEYKSQSGILIAQGNGNHGWQHENIRNSSSPDQPSSMVIDNSGVIHLLYSSDYNKLVYAIKNKDTWNRQTIEIMRDGLSSLAVDIDGNPHIAYATYQSLNYTHLKNGTWSKITIDNIQINRIFHIKLDALNYPHILTPGVSNSDLNYYSWNGINWSKEIIDCQTYFTDYRADLCVDSKGSPRIVFVDEPDLKLKYISKTGNEWNIETVDTDSISHTPAICMDKKDNVHIAYYSDRSGLKYAKRVQNKWSIETVDSSKKAGSHPSIIADKAGNLHIAYIDRNVWQLNYATTKREGFFRTIPIGLVDYLIFIMTSVSIIVITYYSISFFVVRQRIKTRYGKMPSRKKED